MHTQTADRDWPKLQKAFSVTTNDIPTLDSIRSRVRFLAGFKPERYDCCVKTCCCFTGPLKNLNHCPHCNEARYASDGRPRKSFTYLPFIPRLLAFLANKSIAETLLYRANFSPSTDGSRSDIFDGNHYRRLLQQHISVNGKHLSKTYFSDPRDVALGLSTDGFAVFKKRKQTAWPLLVFLYNLPPDQRFLIQNILSLGIIPGPNKPKDFDSFLWPFAQEMLRLACGEKAFDGCTLKAFILRAFLIIIFGDIPAISALMRMKGHNGLSPCRMCEIVAVPVVGNSRNNTHYTPLDRSSHPKVIASHQAAEGKPLVQKYDPGNLPLRTHAKMLEQAQEVQLAPTQVAAEELAKVYGIKGVSILFHLASVEFPVSFPFDFMHVVWENVIKSLILLWTGDFKGLDVGSGSYQLSLPVWQAIGAATTAAGKTIPAAYGPRLPNIATTDQNYCTADMWSFWTLYLGPILLHRQFSNQRYYKHFIDLVRLLNICLKFEITTSDIEVLDTGFQKWVEKYEQ